MSTPWLTIGIPEGFTLQMLAWPTRSGSEDDRATGHLKVTTYNAREGTFTCNAAIREGTAITNHPPRDLLTHWKAEYHDVMLQAGLAYQEVDERVLFGQLSGWDLTFERPDAGTMVRARLIRDHHRLISLVAIGPQERVQIDGEHFLKSFKLA